jgi:tRNA 2-thiouridine synthesizing protein A
VRNHSRYLAKPGNTVKARKGPRLTAPGRPCPYRAAMTEKILNLRGLKCPLPALRTRKALAGLKAGDVISVECTDPLAAIDIPNLLQQTGDTLQDSTRDDGLLRFRIVKR